MLLSSELIAQRYMKSLNLETNNTVPAWDNAMTRLISLEDIMLGNADDFDNGVKQYPIRHCLTHGTQAVLMVFVSLVLNRVRETGATPEGFSALVKSALYNPSLGGLHALVSKAAQEGVFAFLTEVDEFWAQEHRGSGPLQALGQLRNQLEHPKDMSREQVLGKATSLVQSLPGLLREPRIICGDSGRVFWQRSAEQYPLWPVMSFSNTGRLLAGEMDAAGELGFAEPQPEATRAWQGLWSEVRRRDTALDAPTPEEFMQRIQAAEDTIADSPSPWWLGKIWDGKGSALLVQPGEANAVPWNILAQDAATAVLSIIPDSEQSVPEAIAGRLGLKTPPGPQDLLALLPPGHRLLLQVCFPNSMPRHVLQGLLWLADLHEQSHGDRIRLIVVLDIGQVELVWAKHWDRLPDSLDDLLLPAPRSRHADLRKYYWLAERPRRLFGML